MNVLLISTYELGHQPFGLASPAAWLRETGASVRCLDLAVEPLLKAAIISADLVAFYVPMHTATRIAARALRQVREINPGAHLCCYGLYAPVNEVYLRKLGVGTILGGEFEQGLVALVRRLSADGQASQGYTQIEPLVSLARQQFLAPDRSGLPSLSKYAHLNLASGGRRMAGYTEASRGCKHFCRHCPIVPVYQGRFRIVQREVVLEDIRRQVAGGAGHITFGDPDFFNGPAHSLAIVRDLHRAFPELTYDVTIKVEHLLKLAHLLPWLRDTGCLFVTTAVESFDNRVLQLLDKGHTREDFCRLVDLFRHTGLTLNPTFVAFTPWTSLEGYRDFLRAILDLDLVENVSPIQYAIRLLIPSGSKLLDLPETRQLVEAFDEVSLYYPWQHPDPRMDALYEQARRIGQGSQGKPRGTVFQQLWRLACEACGDAALNQYEVSLRNDIPPRATIPYLTEPWFC